MKRLSLVVVVLFIVGTAYMEGLCQKSGGYRAALPRFTYRLSVMTFSASPLSTGTYSKQFSNTEELNSRRQITRFLHVQTLVPAPSTRGTALSLPFPAPGVAITPPNNPPANPDVLLRQSAAVQSLASCIRNAEEDGLYTWGYTSRVSTGDGGGAYQFEPSTWYHAAQFAGITPTTHSPIAQDDAFVALYDADGTAPWRGDSCITG